MPSIMRRMNVISRCATAYKTENGDIESISGCHHAFFFPICAHPGLSQDALVKKQFYYSHCADEVFLHSLAMAAPCRDTVIDNCLRAIDWERGDPYVFRQEDVEDLLASANLFARKFDSKIDPQAIDHIVAHLTKNQ